MILLHLDGLLSLFLSFSSEARTAVHTHISATLFTLFLYYIVQNKDGAYTHQYVYMIRSHSISIRSVLK